MYLQLTRDNAEAAQVNDNGWPRVEANGQNWERTEDGVWENVTTGDRAVRQRSGNWRYRKRTYKSIKQIMLLRRKRLHQKK